MLRSSHFSLILKQVLPRSPRAQVSQCNGCSYRLLLQPFLHQLSCRSDRTDIVKLSLQIAQSAGTSWALPAAGACLSPDGQCAACWQAQSCSLSLLEADSKQEAAVTLSPAAGKSANGKAGPAKPADVLTLGAWNADSSTLAVATAGGGIYLVSRRWELLSCGPARRHQLGYIECPVLLPSGQAQLCTAFAPADDQSQERCALQGRSGASRLAI